MASKKPYSDDEIKLLKEIFEQSPKDFIISKFPGRSSQSIFRTAKKLGLKRSREAIGQDIAKGTNKHEDCWSEKELTTLKEIYPSNSKNLIESNLPGRNWRSIRTKALRLDLHRNPKLCRQDREKNLMDKGDHWSPEEDNTLFEIYPNNSKKIILNKINKPWTAIHRRALKLDLRRDTNLIDEDRKIRYKPRKDSCSEEEKQILLQFFEHNTKEFIIEKLSNFNRSPQSIVRFARQLGLKRNPELLNQERIEAGKKGTAAKEDLWKPEEDQILIEFYAGTLQEDIEKKFPGRTFRAIRIRALHLGLNRNKEIIDQDRDKKSKITLMEKYGVNCSLKIPEAAAKSLQTNLDRRGVPYHTQTQEGLDKVKATVQERFGVDNVFQAEEIKKEIIKTNLKIFGVKNPNQSPEVQEQARQTNQKKYGVDNPFQLIDRVQAGMMNKYGVKYPLQNSEIRAKQQATNMERYGTPTPAQNEDVRNKLKKILNTPEVKEKKYIALKNKGNFSSSAEEDDLFPFFKNIDPDTGHHVLHPLTKDIIDYYLPLFDIWIQYDGGYWHGKKKTVPGPQADNINKTVNRDKIQNESIPNLIRLDSNNIEKVKKENRLQDFLKEIIEEKSESSCYQHRKKIQYYGTDLNSLPFNPDNLKASNFDLSSEKISDEIIAFIEKYEWLGTMGVSPKWCFTARYKGFLGGVVLINEPTAYSKILGENTPQYEALIQRGASASWTPKNLGSRLIMFACKWMVNNTKKRAFIGYADLNAKERGIIYRACNFDFLGNDFGVSEMLKHPYMPGLFTSHSLKRTSMFIKWCRENNIAPEKSWFKENGFKNLETIPAVTKENWYNWCKKIVLESEKIAVEKKLKYVLILGKNKRETKLLCNLKEYKPQPYPENSNKKSPFIRIGGITKNRLNIAKEQFIIDNYGKLTTLEIAKAMDESPRWIKRILIYLSNKGKIVRKHPNKGVENLLTTKNWNPIIKNKAISLRMDFLKSSHEICSILEKEFEFVIGVGALNFWFKKFNVLFPSKKEWLQKFLPIEKVIELKNKNYRVVDFKKYLKDTYGVYISDDIISLYLRSILPC